LKSTLCDKTFDKLLKFYHSDSEVPHFWLIAKSPFKRLTPDPKQQKTVTKIKEAFEVIKKRRILKAQPKAKPFV
jgi:hypothetical protein